MGFSLYAYQSEKPGDRSGAYYRGRFRFYGGLTTLVGLAQLMLGSYIQSKFGPGPLDEPVAVAMFVVNFPGISIFVGLVYLLNGFFGMARAFRLIKAGENNHIYQMTMALQYLCTLILMVIVQMSYSPGDRFAPAAPSVSCLTLAAHVFPAYLDFKARTTPEVLPANYYGVEEEQEQEQEEYAPDISADITEDVEKQLSVENQTDIEKQEENPADIEKQEEHIEVNAL
jgi:hypothetical protein